LDGTFVKSKGEKYIADWLFEHGVNYYYEDLTYWNTDCEPQGHPYRPDFTVIWGGRRYFLEHWALDPADPFAELPTEWTQTADQYRQQIAAKRRFWKQRSAQKGVIFLETHAGMLTGSREHVCAQLAALRRSVGVDPKPLPEDAVRKRVLENPLQHSRMARLFLQFIQRAKRKGWSAENVRALLKKKPLKDQKLSAFYEMALVMLREY